MADEEKDDDALLSDDDVESLLGSARASAQDEAGADPKEAMFDELTPQQPEEGGEGANLDLIKDVSMDVRIELGRSRMYIQDVLRLRTGSVVELDKLSGEPVDIMVNDRLVARGQVLVLNNNFCVRITEIISREERKELTDEA